MRIASFGSITPEMGGPTSGGVASYHSASLEALDSSSCLVDHITLVPNKIQHEAEGLPAKCSLLVLGAKDRNGSQLNQLSDDHDALIVHHLNNKWTDAFVDQGLGAKLVCVVHSWTVLLRNPNLKERLQYNMDMAGTLVFPSHHSLKQAGEFGLTVPEKACVIHGPLNLEFCKPAPESTDRSNIIFAGSLIDIKRCHLLISAMQELPKHVGLIIAGDGTLRPELEAMVIRLGLTSRIVFKGNLSLKELRAVYEEGSLLCVPSASESMGLVYIESLARGMPVVGYSASIAEISEAIGAECGFGFVGESANPLALILNSALTREWDRKELSNRTRDIFSTQRFGANFDAVLKEYQNS
jgi:glycosyltransferase involved in cell wall biosynthesis